MARLADYNWQTGYTPGDGDLIARFYNPLLGCARRYDRTTGFYSADTLVLAMRGIEAMVRNGGKMRLLASCRLAEPEIAAIRRGEDLAGTLEASLLANPLRAASELAADGLELLAWLVAQRILEIRIGVMKDPVSGRPLCGMFHEKAGVVEDGAGDRLAFAGSLNETLAAWKSYNWDTFHVFRSWGPDCAHVERADREFGKLWANQAGHVEVLPLSAALARDLMRFLPPVGALPRRLRPAGEFAQPAPKPAAPDAEYERVWRLIREGAKSGPGSEWVGVATSAVAPWPHQLSAFCRMYQNWPPRLLIADEVGLGKTIQAGLLLRQALLAGRISHALIMAPKAVLGQWQAELSEKFNIQAPIYDDNRLRWPDGRAEAVSRWQDQGIVLASSQLMRLYPDQALAGDWDLVILDEAHHARRKGRRPGGPIRNEPNRLLRLMRKLAPQTRGLLLLTATPMQVDPLELWDLLSLLGLPEEWHEQAFLDFFGLVRQPAPTDEALEKAAALFRSAVAAYGPMPQERLARLGFGKIAARRIIGDLTSQAAVPRKRFSHKTRLDAMRIMAAHTPVAALVSRHTRELLREYRRKGRHNLNLAEREVSDLLVPMLGPERAIYEAVEDYIVSTWNGTPEASRQATGFVLSVYRRRLASSFAALAATLTNRLANVEAFGEEDLPDDDLAFEQLDDSSVYARQARDEAQEIERLLQELSPLDQDSKAVALMRCLAGLEKDGYAQVMIFTQFTDTMDWLSGEICARFGQDAVLRYSGRGGEIWNDGWQRVSRGAVASQFRAGKSRFLLCTDAAAEGLNFQFCGALVNYDMPWNPMRVEQRIGRIDRLGQEHAKIRIVNLMYADTVETDIYLALRRRIDLFGRFVGRLQPILARLPRLFAASGLNGDAAGACAEIETMLGEESFDIDAACADEIALPARIAPAWDLSLLRRVLAEPRLMPPGYAASQLGSHDWQLIAPGAAQPWRVSVDAEFYANHVDSVAFWTPGSPLFPGYSQRSGQ